MNSTNELPKQLGDFEILREVGRGGMGIVFEARQISLNRKVALKVLSGFTAKAVLRFQREAEAAGKLHHTNIVPIYSTGEDNGLHYYAMEFVEGPSLAQVIRHTRETQVPKPATGDAETAADHEALEHLPDWVAETIAFEEPRTESTSQSTTQAASGLSGSGVTSGTRYFDTVAAMIADVADALDHAHDHGVIHRDIKPSNLLLGPDGRLSVNDFGLARVLEEPGMTMSGDFIGTPRYMSPEQITAGKAPLDHRTDIYSLGSSLYELLTLQPPFNGKTRDEIIGQVLHQEPRPPRLLNRRIPRDLEAICVKAMERDPARRYQTAQQMATDLRAFVNRFAVSAKRIGPIARFEKWVRRKPLAAAFGCFVLFSVIAAMVGVYAWQQDIRHRELEDTKQRMFMALLRGDIESAEELRDEAIASGASEPWQHLTRGQIEVYRGNYNQARREFDSFLEHDRDSISAKAMLAIAHLYGGDTGAHFKLLNQLERRAEPKSFDDHVFMGYAFGWTRPEKSLELLKAAERQEPNHPFVRLLLAMSYRCCAMNCADQHEASRLADLAIKHAIVARELLEDSPRALCEFALAHWTASQAHSRLSALDINSSQHHTELAKDYLVSALSVRKELGQAIESFFPQYTLAMLSLAHDDHTIGMDRLARQLDENGCEPNPFVANFICVSYTQTGDFGRARNWHRRAGRQEKQAKFLLYLTEIASGEKDSISLRYSFRKHLDKKLADSDETYLPYDWTVCALLLDDEYCKRLTTFIEQNVSDRYPDLQTKVAFLRQDGLGDPEVFVSQFKDSRREYSEALFFAGAKSLSLGYRDTARKYFHRCVEQDYYAQYVHWQSRTFAALLERDNKWPHWIPDRHR